MTEHQETVTSAGRGQAGSSRQSHHPWRAKDQDPILSCIALPCPACILGSQDPTKDASAQKSIPQLSVALRLGMAHSRFLQAQSYRDF